jgi:hypothetical protein
LNVTGRQRPGTGARRETAVACRQLIPAHPSPTATHPQARHAIRPTPRSHSALASPLHARRFDFDATPVGTTVSFSLTSGGVTATFASPDPGAFFVTDAFFATLSGHVLLDDDRFAHVLLVTFSRPLSAISLAFALSFGGATLDHVVLTSNAVAFAVDDIVVRTTVAPKPAPLALLLPMVVSLGAVARLAGGRDRVLPSMRSPWPSDGSCERGRRGADSAS